MLCSKPKCVYSYIVIRPVHYSNAEFVIQKASQSVRIAVHICATEAAKYLTEIDDTLKEITDCAYALSQKP